MNDLNEGLISMAIEEAEEICNPMNDLVASTVLPLSENVDTNTSTPTKNPPIEKFKVTKSGVYCYDDEKSLFVCSPLKITAITRDEHNGNFGRLLEWDDTDGKPHKWAMPMGMLAGDGLGMREVLLRGGLTSIAPYAKKLLIEYVSCAQTENRASVPSCP